MTVKRGEFAMSIKGNKSWTWLVFAGAVCWSLNAPFVKYINMDPMLLCAMRSLVAGIVLSPFIFRKKTRLSKSLIGYIICYVGNTACLVIALKAVPSAIAVGMQYTGMIWLFGIALMKKQTTLSFRTIMPIATVVMGVVLFMVSGSSGDYSAAGMLAAISESLFFAGITYFAKDAGGDDPLALTSIANLATAIFVFALPSTALADIGTIDGTNWLLLLFLGTCQLGAGYTLYNIGLKHVLPHKASMIAIWEMILGPVWCLIFLGEVPAMMVVAGFVLILAGMLADGILAGIKASENAVHLVEDERNEEHAAMTAAAGGRRAARR